MNSDEKKIVDKSHSNFLFVRSDLESLKSVLEKYSDSDLRSTIMANTAFKVPLSKNNKGEKI